MILSKYINLVGHSLYEVVFTFRNAMRVGEMLKISNQDIAENITCSRI